jgi:predicted transcriptional regulator
MADQPAEQLSRRERQIMDVVYRLGQATAAEVLAELPDPPGKTAVRTLLRILEEKGHLRHRQEGLAYVYLPSRPRDQAGRSALRRVLQTFFDGSLEKAVAAHLGDAAADLSREELERLADLIRQARKKGT